MKKIRGITFGGLQQKILNRVLLFVLVIVVVFVSVSFYQSGILTEIVGDARVEQQKAVSALSEQTMHAVMESLQGTTTALQAEIADNDFAEVVGDIHMMTTMVRGVLENRENLTPVEVAPPDPAKDGTVTAHVLYEEGVDYTRSEYLGYVGHLSAPLIALCANSEKIASCYVGLADGTHLSIDSHSANRFDENGNQIPYPVRQRPWYRGAVDTGKLYFTGIEKDAFSDQIGITVSEPVTVDGEIVAVVGADIFMDNMRNFVTAYEGSGFSFIVNQEGKVILAPENNGMFTVNTADLSKDLRTLGNEQLAQFIDQALAGSAGLTLMTLEDKTCYLASSLMPTIGWALISVVDKEVTDQPAVQMLAQIDEINQASSAAFKARKEKVGNITLLLVIGLVLLGSVITVINATKIVKPLEQMTLNIVESGETGKMFEMKNSYRTGDEIEVLAEAFDDLSKKTRQYIHDITEITREKERIGTELELARKIQEDMLPYIYPAFPDRPEFDIYATMNPAKEVGGDFYDFFLIDDDHLAMVVADVSGKGVPAALFMMMSKILINNFAMMGGSPAKVLEQTNAAICQNNEHEMFVTVWFGVLEISTGKITAANAGHEYPIVRRANGDFEFFKDRHGFVLGGMDGVTYQDYEMTIEKGGMLFLYTDGVPEATNVDNELFGNQRLLDAMNRSGARGPVELLSSVKSAVASFVGEADQFDDLTMLGLILRKG